jgi:hypothetical protein
MDFFRFGRVFGHGRGDGVGAKTFRRNQFEKGCALARGSFPEIFGIETTISHKFQQIPQLPLVFGAGLDDFVEGFVMAEGVEKFASRAGGGAQAAKAEQCAEREDDGVLVALTELDGGAPDTVKFDGFIAGGMENGKGLGDEPGAVFGEDGASVAGLVAEAKTAHIEDKVFDGGGGVGGEVFGMDEAGEVAGLWSAEVAFLAGTFHLVIHPIPETVAEPAVEPAQGAGTSGFEGEVEVTIGFEAVAPENARFAGVGV